MSSTLEIIRICENCGNEFTAKTTRTKYCSHKCNSAHYKAKKRAEKVEASDIETKQQINIPIEDLKQKPFLSISETMLILGISRRTVYRMIQRKEIGYAKVGSRTIIRRSDLDKLFDNPEPLKEIKPRQIDDFYTIEEIENIYGVKYGKLHKILKTNRIPNTMFNNKLHISKTYFDKYFKKANERILDITEWYTTEEIQDKFGLNQNQVYGRVHDYNIPKKRVGRMIKISKIHFDKIAKPIM